jgi:hypothetical protein
LHDAFELAADALLTAPTKITTTATATPIGLRMIPSLCPPLRVTSIKEEADSCKSSRRPAKGRLDVADLRPKSDHLMQRRLNLVLPMLDRHPPSLISAARLCGSAGERYRRCARTVPCSVEGLGAGSVRRRQARTPSAPSFIRLTSKDGSPRLLLEPTRPSKRLGPPAAAEGPARLYLVAAPMTRHARRCWSGEAPRRTYVRVVGSADVPNRLALPRPQQRRGVRDRPSQPQRRPSRARGTVAVRSVSVRTSFTSVADARSRLAFATGRSRRERGWYP